MATLPAPRTVELIAMAMTGRVPAPNPEDAGWWYPMVERRVRLAGDRTAPLAMEEHADPIAEAVRWSICEGELIQAMGRGRGLRPTRRDLMALSGIALENAADMAACFPELWPTREAAKKDGQRKGTNDYYRDLYNSRMSPSSAEVTYRPEGPGHRARTARVELSRIPDPEAWLTNRLGPLASFEMRHIAGAGFDASDPADAARLDTLASRLTASMQAVLAARRAALDALSARLEVAKPAALRRPHHPQPEEETEA